MAEPPNAAAQDAISAELTAYRSGAFERAREEAEHEPDIASRAADGEVELAALLVDEAAAFRACDEQWSDYVSATAELARAAPQAVTPRPSGELQFPSGRFFQQVREVLRWWRALTGEERAAPSSSRPPPTKTGKQRSREALVAARDLAQTRFEESLRQAIARLLRTALEDKIADDYSTALTVGPEDAPGLAELSGDELNAVETESVKRLNQLLKRMPGGSIGLSGQRGAGKSTLIRKVCDGTNHKRDRPAVACVVSAPTRYDAREFVLHLMGALCERIIGGPKARAQRKQVRAEAAAGPLGGRLAALGRWLLLATPVAGLLLVMAGVTGLNLEPAVIAAGVCVSLAVPLLPFGFYYLPYPFAFLMRPFFVSFPPFSSRDLARRTVVALTLSAVVLALYAGLDVSLNPVVGWGIVVFAGAVLGRIALYDPLNAARGAEFSLGIPQSDLPETLVRRAEDGLDTIEYQQTITTGWSGAFKSKVGLEASVTGSRARAELPLTFPEVVGLLRNFILDVATEADVFVGIDELDKMQPDDAEQFLNDIKGVFGLTNCFFLVSVSEEAMSGFERRGARLRDVFDSSFDEIFQVAPMTLDESRLLLTERVSGVPVPYHALCHVMSGGLPRDTIRVARAMISLRPADAPGRLSDVAAGLIGLELKARARAVVVIARDIPVEPETSAFLGWADQLGTIAVAPTELMRECRRHDFMAGARDGASQVEADRDREPLVTLQGLAVELIAFCYFAATVLGLFATTLGEVDVKAIRNDPFGGSFEDVATGRRLLALNPRVGWSRIDAFRKQRQMEPYQFPLDLAKVA